MTAVGASVAVFEFRRRCRDVAQKAPTRLTVVVLAQAGTQCGGWCSDTRGSRFRLRRNDERVGLRLWFRVPAVVPRCRWKAPPRSSVVVPAQAGTQCDLRGWMRLRMWRCIERGGRRADHVSAVAHLQAALRCALRPRSPPSWGVQQRWFAIELLVGGRGEFMQDAAVRGPMRRPHCRRSITNCCSSACGLARRARTRASWVSMSWSISRHSALGSWTNSSRRAISASGMSRARQWRMKPSRSDEPVRSCDSRCAHAPAPEASRSSRSSGWFRRPPGGLRQFAYFHCRVRDRCDTRNTP